MLETKLTNNIPTRVGDVFPNGYMSDCTRRIKGKTNMSGYIYKCFRREESSRLSILLVGERERDKVHLFSYLSDNVIEYALCMSFTLFLFCIMEIIWISETSKKN